jgi:NADPH-dependent ferric siderophore reductase
MGPRGKVVPDDSATWHLFACDESGWAATAAIVESLGSDRTALVFAEIAGPDEVQTLATQAVVHVEWLERGSHRPGEPDLLLGSLESAALPDGVGHAYLSAELAVVRTIADLLSRRGLAPEQVSAKAYWRLGVANHAYGEPPRERA